MRVRENLVGDPALRQPVDVDERRSALLRRCEASPGAPTPAVWVEPTHVSTVVRRRLARGRGRGVVVDGTRWMVLIGDGAPIQRSCPSKARPRGVCAATRVGLSLPPPRSSQGERRVLASCELRLLGRIALQQPRFSSDGPVPTWRSLKRTTMAGSNHPSSFGLDQAGTLVTNCTRCLVGPPLAPLMVICNQRPKRSTARSYSTTSIRWL